MAKTSEPELNPCLNLLGNGTTIEGNIQTHGDIRIDGVFKGNIQTASKLVIGATGIVEGEIICQNADIEGAAKSNIKVAELMSLKSTASVVGNINVGKLSIENGAMFSGQCVMRQNHDNINEEN